MAVSHHTVTERWADRARTAHPEDRLSTTGTNVFADGDRIYSYGHHFEMARIVRDKRNEPTHIIINGDRYSNTTSGHQSHVRTAARGTGLPNVVVPYSALSAAGIDIDSIEPVDILADRYTYHARIMSVAQMLDSAWRFREDDGIITDHYIAEPERQPEFVGDGKYRVWDKRHWLGEAVFRARVHDQRDRRATEAEIADYERWKAYMSHLNELESVWRALNDEMTAACRALEEFYGGRHFMHWDTVRERLPGPVREEYDALAERAGDAWIKFSDARHSSHTPDSHGIRVRHNRSGVSYWITEQRTRTAYFLSAFDHNEARECYFLCELPRGARPTTVDEAFDALKPDAVRGAESAGLEVERQGDIFAIPTAFSTKELKSMRKRGTDIIKRGVLLGTNHTASEVIETRHGTFARGILRHEPGRWREADHARRKMGDGRTWHRIVKNTVPLAGNHYSGGGGGANQSGQSRAWTMGGNVD